MADDWGKVLTPEDITQEFAEGFYSACIDGWYEDGPIDWESAIERWERYHRKSGPNGEDVTFGPETQGPAERKLRRLVRAIRAESF